MTRQPSQRKKAKISLRVKMFIALILVGVPPVSVALLSAYVKGREIRESNIGGRFENTALSLAEGIRASFSNEIAEAKSLALTPTLLDAVAGANESYGGKDQEAILAEIKAIDDDWRTAPKINEKIRSYLSNSVSRYLQNILELRADKYAEIFVTDEQGAIVGATGKTTDFYQADEIWWQKAFSGGNGRNIIKGVEFDESAQQQALTIAVPVRDPASHTVMGVLKVVMRTEYLFRFIDTFRVEEKGGYAGLTNRDRELLATSAPSKPGHLGSNFWETIVGESKGWAKATNEMGRENVLGFAVIETSGVDGNVILNGGQWFVFIHQDTAEAYARISETVYQVFALGFGLVLALSMLGLYATNRIVMPIRLLREEAQYIARGDLGRRVEIHTNDEIELLADDINMMSEKLKEVHADLEQKIDERTVELSEANKRLEAQRRVLLKVNKQLMKASTLKSEFLADICDGLNNPVLNIIRLAEAVSQGGTDGLEETQRAYLGDVLSNAKHLHQLINEVFTLARATSGKMELKLSRFPVEDTLREVMDTVKALATEKNIRFEFEIDGEVAELTADLNLFKHIVFNLYTNAIKYSRISAKVVTSACIADSSMEISVADTGAGIRPDDQERIFYEFERVEDTQTPYYEGSGMGLALAQRFVEMHRGKIWVESEYGKGSRFVFRIPPLSLE